ncbi:MAG: DUF4331 domain-containing protein [Myxococcales bacterium]|jgi:hypothetical protein|nr:DUF4331 domain-containing protein [Myxococcales bacterium]
MRARIGGALVAAFAIGAALTLPAKEASASSHREAPFITQNPKVDGTDFYMFKSYQTGRAGYVTLIANYSPLQSNYGGPNFFTMDPEAIYEIHVDNTGDAKEDITFQFRFFNALNDPTGLEGLTVPGGHPGGATKLSVPLLNIGDVSDPNNQASRNVKEEYELKVIRGPRRGSPGTNVARAAGPAGANPNRFVKPLDFIGTKSFGSAAAYDTYANAHIYDVEIPGCADSATNKARVFVGQRQEGFAVNLGPIFDLVNAPASVLTDPSLDVANPIGDKNVTSIAMEIPVKCLTKSDTEPVIGAWTTASVRQARAINPTGTFAKPSREGGAWVQVSRLGMPLVNEVVIGLKDKNKFNNSEPANDVANFGAYVLNPTLPTLLEVLFGAAGVKAPTEARDKDLLPIFATGVAGVNVVPKADAVGSAPGEMLRLNTSFPATSAADQLTKRPAGVPTQLGAALCFSHPGGDTTKQKTLDGAAVARALEAGTGPTEPCDLAGFPNGRRPGDDVVDIALRVVIGYMLGTGAGQGGAGTGMSSLPLGDAVGQHADQFLEVFPYLKRPNPGS